MSVPPIAWRWGEVDAREHGAEVCLTHAFERAELWIRDGRLCRGRGYERAPAAARRALARVGAIVRLRQRGRYFLHASGVIDPAGRALLFAGDSGSGKSTLAYALARAGWRVLGDDGVVLDVREGPVGARGWREPLLVSGALSDAFPELAAHLTHAEPAGSSACLRVSLPSDARARMPVSMPFSRGAVVAGLFLVRRSARHAVTRAGPLAALAALVRQSPWVILGDAHARNHLDALRRAAALPAFQLDHTPAELHRLPSVLTEALA